MDYLPEIETLSTWLLNYGSFALFFLLALGIIALPVPEETLMVVAGTLMFRGNLPILPTIIAAMGGSICGITVSYLLGRTAELYLIHKYGGWLGITEERFRKVHIWFEKYGKWALLIGYFIPGVRHFTGIFAGATNLGFKYFSLFAYSGAFIWVSTFLSLGYFFGNYGLSLLEKIDVGVDEVIVVCILIILCLVGFILRRYRRR